MTNVIKTPRALDIAVSNRCNQRCKYCYHFSGPGDVKTELSKEEWLAFFEEMGRCAVLCAILGGGEPLCREDIEELIIGIVKNHMRFRIVTNGTLITKNFADFLASTKRCEYVQISIDGSCDSVHDSMRGQGTFLKAVQGIQLLQNAGVAIRVRLTIHPANLLDLPAAAKFLLEDIGLPAFSTNCACYFGLCRNNPATQLSVEQYSFAIKTLLMLEAIYEGRITAEAGPLANGRIWLQMLQARKNNEATWSNGGYLKSCGGVMIKLDVRADGVMVPCTQMSHIELGRVNHDRLDRVWQDHPELKRLRERIDIPLRSFELCRTCDYVDYCLGGCPATAYTIENNAYKPSPDSCLRLFLKQGGTLPSQDWK